MLSKVYLFNLGRWVPAGETIGPETSLDIDGLTPGHKYKFRVRAVNKQGKSEPLQTGQAIEAKNPFSEYEHQCCLYTGLGFPQCFI